MSIFMPGVYRDELDLRMLKLTNQMTRHMILIVLVTRRLSGKASTIRERIMATYAFNINYATLQNKGSEDRKM